MSVASHSSTRPGRGRGRGARKSSSEGSPHATPGRRTSDGSRDTGQWTSNIKPHPGQLSSLNENSDQPASFESNTNGVVPKATPSEAASETGAGNQDLMPLNLRVSSLSSKSTVETITEYFEAQGENINVSAVEMLENGAAVVHLMDITEEEREQLLKKKHKISRKQVVVEEVPLADTTPDTKVVQSDATYSCSSNILMVRNLPEAADEHLLEMYFESSKSGGCPDAIESIDFVEPDVARITLKDSEVASRIWGKKVHKVQGTELQISSWEPDMEESLTASVNNTIEVSNLPQDCTEDMLELYFDNPRSGGCVGGVKAVQMVGVGLAQIEFINASIAANVLAKEGHKFKKNELQIKLQTPIPPTETEVIPDTLEVSNLPDNITKDVLEMYFESSKSGGCDGAVKDVTFIGPKEARVQFTTTETVDAVLKKKVHKLQGTELQVKVYQVKLLASPYSRTRDTLEVTGLPDDISKDVLELYFENPKSGGCPDAVKDISFPRHGVAQIQFTSDTIAAAVIEKKEHKLKGSELQIKYVDIQEDTVSNSEPVRDTLQVSNLPADMSEDILEMYFESPKSGGCVDAVKEVLLIRPGVAQIQFSTASVAAEVMSKKVHKLKECVLKVKFSDKANTTTVSDDTLEVRNFPSNVPEEYLQYYFDSPKSGGCANAVKEITLVKPGLAKVLFSSPKIAANVHAMKRHMFSGAELQVQYLKLSHDDDDLEDKDEASAMCDTLEISNLTTDITKDYLELYFGNPMSGGCADCVKEIKMLKNGVAHVQFADTKTAANVLEKKLHKVKEVELHVKYLPAALPKACEMNKLILQDIPAEVDDDYLHLFTENCLKLSDSDFSMSRSKDKALLTFTKERTISELKAMIKELQAKSLKQGCVTAVLYEVCNSIRLHGITEHYEEDYIHMYFEASQKSGGGPVEAVQMLGEGQAIITFKDPKVVPAVLERSHSSFGTHIKIERNDPFHTPAVPSVNTSSVGISVDPIVLKYLSKRPELIHKLVKELHVILEFDDGGGKIVCSSTKCTKSGWKKIAKRSITSYIDSTYITLSNILVPKDALPELNGHLSSLKDLEFSFSKDGTVLQVGGEKKVVHDFEITLKEMFDRYTVETVSIGFTQNPADFQFLVQVKLPELRSQVPQIQITEDPHVLSLKLRGTKKEIGKFQEMLPKLYAHSQVNVEVPSHVASYMGTADGQLQLKCILKKENIQVAVYFGPLRQPVLLFDSVHLSSVKKIKTRLNEMVSFSERRVPSSFEVKQEKYVQLRQKFEKEHHVQVSHSSNVLVVAGIKSGVAVVMTELFKFIEESCTVDECISVERGELRLLLSHMRSKWEEITKKAMTSDFTVTLSVPELQKNDDDPVSKIQLRGERDCVKEVSDKITQLKRAICKRSEVIEQADTSFLASENARTYLDGIEAREKVIIEVMLPESNSEIVLTDNGKYSLKCTAKLTKKRRIYIFIGDICDFDIADVIVNAANMELKHIGGVAYAIAKKGGAIINKASKQFIKKHGKLETGNAWLTTEVGNLPCKALVHAVGPVWSGKHDRDALLLESACMQALQKSSLGQGYKSIAFPAISTGVYGFPIDKCAQCMIKSMIKFSDSDTPSDIENIHFVIHPSKSADIKHFISALKHSLPTDSVSVNDELSQATKHEATTKVSSIPRGTSQFKKGEPAIKKNSCVSKGAAIPNIPPGVLNCIKLVKGSLLDVQADVYVNTTNNQLNLSSGAVSMALLKAGGKTLQDECTKKGPIKTGDVAITGPGQIQCQHIFHTVIPTYDGKASEKVLRSSLNKCFKECASRGMISIAVPSIGTGNLNFPKEVVAKITIDEAISFLSTKKRGSLEFVHLVIFMQDTYKAFQDVLSEYSSQEHITLPVNAGESDDDGKITPSPMSLARVKRSRLVGSRSTTLPSTTSGTSERQVFTIDNLSIELIIGDITESTCDVIINSTNAEMKLNGAGVAGAILSKGGQEQQNLCDAVVSAIGTLDEDKVVCTKATGKLRCKHIFHINYEGRDLKKLSKVILTCLDKAEKMKLTSVAFPAVGTGTNACQPQESAVGMLQAFRTFVSTVPLNLHQLQVVVSQPQVLQAFMYAFQHPEEAQPGIFTQAWNYLSSFIPGGPSSNPDTPKVVPVMEELGPREPLEVVVYGETEKAVNQAHHKLNCWISETLSDRRINNKNIQNMSETDEERLRKISKNSHVEIDIDRDSSFIRLKGSRLSVDAVHTALTESLYQYEKRLDKMQHAKQLYEVVRWRRMDSSNSEGEEYEEIPNYEIEMAHRAGKSNCTFGTKNDIDYFSVDFTTSKETDHHSGIVCKVERVDVLRQLQEGEKPPTWDKMPSDSSLHIVKLDAKSKEYADVKQQFDRTMGRRYTQIVHIERIQNPALYLQYIGRKKEMDRQNPKGHQNERMLFHGTSQDTCPKINRNGFNRSFAGKNAVAFGKGVYFARDASYSASSTYSPPDVNGYRYIYLVRALTGEFTGGNRSMIVPPHKDPNKFIEYDSVVDNPANPSIFVIFYDALVYPDYLITFQ